MYPYDGQKDVALSFDGYENPNPLEKLGVKKSGFVVTIKPNAIVDGIDAKITNSKGESIPFFTLNDNGYWHMLPKAVLDANETYTVSVNYTATLGRDVGKAFNKTWSFTTADRGYKSKSTVLLLVGCLVAFKNQDKSSILIANGITIFIRSFVSTFTSITSHIPVLFSK